MAALRSNLAEAVTLGDELSTDKGHRHSIAVRLSALALVIAAMVAVGAWLSAWLDPIAVLRAWVSRAGPAGPPVFVALFLVLNTVGLPLPVLGTAAGVAFGPIAGGTTSLVAMAITAAAQFLLARYVVGDRVRQRLGHRMVRVNQLLERRGAIAVAAARLVPMPFSEFNMLAGLTLLRLRVFVIGTTIGCAPKALAWSGLGAIFF